MVIVHDAGGYLGVWGVGSLPCLVSLQPLCTPFRLRGGCCGSNEGQEAAGVVIVHDAGGCLDCKRDGPKRPASLLANTASTSDTIRSGL